MGPYGRFFDFLKKNKDVCFGSILFCKGLLRQSVLPQASVVQLCDVITDHVVIMRGLQIADAHAAQKLIHFLFAVRNAGIAKERAVRGFDTDTVSDRNADLITPGKSELIIDVFYLLSFTLRHGYLRWFSKTTKLYTIKKALSMIMWVFFTLFCDFYQHFTILFDFTGFISRKMTELKFILFSA